MRNVCQNKTSEIFFILKYKTEVLSAITAPYPGKKKLFIEISVNCVS